MQFYIKLNFVHQKFKCPIFKFVSDNKVIFSAKQKYNELYIAEGADIHIKNKKKSGSGKDVQFV